MSVADIRRGGPRVRHHRATGGHEARPYTGMVSASRIALLYLVSRRFAQTLIAIAALAILIWWAMGRTPTPEDMPGVDLAMATARNETLLLHLAASLLASVIGIALWSPFGETERVSPMVLPVMRALHLFAMFAIGCAALAIVISGWKDVMPGVDLVPLFVRNALFLTGLVLLVCRFVDVRLAWMLPVMLGGVTITGLLQDMAEMAEPSDFWRNSGWNILALGASHGWATGICLGLGIVAFAVYIRDGVRDAAEGE